MLKNVHRFAIDDKVKEGAFKIIPPPAEIEEICKDVQVLGKREMTTLLKYRQRVNKREGKHKFEEKRKIREEAKSIKEQMKTDEDYEAEAEEELNQQIDT